MSTEARLASPVGVVFGSEALSMSLRPSLSEEDAHDSMAMSCEKHEFQIDFLLIAGDNPSGLRARTSSSLSRGKGAAVKWTPSVGPWIAGVKV
jgi:hypothetical protein